MFHLEIAIFNQNKAMAIKERKGPNMKTQLYETRMYSQDQIYLKV